MLLDDRIFHISYIYIYITYIIVEEGWGAQSMSLAGLIHDFHLAENNTIISAQLLCMIFINIQPAAPFDVF